MSNILKAHQIKLLKDNVFAQLIVPASQKTFPMVTQLPLLFDETKQCFYGHLARNNSVCPFIDNKSQLMVLIDGGHEYISPRWHDEQKVPTWNYARLELICEVTIIDNADDKLALVNEMSNTLDPSWQLGDILAPHFTKKLQQMINAITAFRLDIKSASGRFKLGQKKSPDYHEKIADQMLLQGNAQLACWQRHPPEEY